MADGSADRPRRVPVAGRGRRGSLVNTGASRGPRGWWTLGANPPGPESVWPEGSRKHRAPVGWGWIRAGGKGLDPQLPREGGQPGRGIWAGGAGFSLAPPPWGQHAGCLAPGPRAPPGGQACWHLTPVLTLPPPTPSQRPGPGPPGRTPVVQGVPSALPEPQASDGLGHTHP